MNRRTIALAIVSGVILVVIWLFLSSLGSSKLTITTPGTTPDNSEISVRVTRDGLLEKEFILQPGDRKTLRLKKGTVRVDGSAGNLKAVDVVEIGKTKELLTPNGEQRATSKLGSNAVFCPIVLAEKVFSYNCFGDGMIVQHPSSTQSSTMFSEQVFAELKPLKNGLIGFHPNTLNELYYLDLPTETQQRVQLPTEVQTALNAEFPNIVVSSDPGASHFALVFAGTNQIFLMKDIADTSPVKIVPPIALQAESRQTTPSFSHKEFILYAGDVQDDHTDGTEIAEDGQHEDLPSHVFEYNMEGNLVRTINLPNGFNASGGIYKLVNNYYEAEQNASIDFYYLEGENLKQIYQIYDISSWVNVNDAVYLQTDGTLYQFVPGEQGLFGLHSLFSSPEIFVSQVFGSEHGGLFTGYVGNNQTDFLNIYQLLDTTVDPSTATAPSVKVETRFVGFEALLDFGVSADQVNGLQEAIKRYIDISGKPTGQAVIANVGIVARAYGSVGGADTAHFDLSLDNESFKAKMEYFSLSDMRLYIYSSGGALLFDSAKQ